MNKAKYDKIWLGMIIGLVVPIIVFFVFSAFHPGGFNIKELVDFLVENEVYTNVLSLCVFPNLVMFFLLLNRNLYKASRGIMFMVFVYAFIVMSEKLF